MILFKMELSTIFTRYHVNTQPIGQLVNLKELAFEAFLARPQTSATVRTRATGCTGLLIRRCMVLPEMDAKAAYLR